MVDYIQNRRFYSANSEFLSGDDVFSGYVIRNGDQYTDVYYNPLTAASTHLTDLHTSDFYRDRLISDTLELPNLLSSIEIQANDLLTNRLINNKFELLHDNNTYLYSRLQAPNNYLPASGTVRYAALTGTGADERFEWFNTIVTTTEYLSSTNYTDYENIVHGIGVVRYDDTSKFTLFCTTSTSFIALTGSDTDLIPVENSTYVAQSGTDMQFGNITSIDMVDNYLYICDKGNNAIYKYDVESYFSGDTSFNYRRIFIEGIGAIGATEDRGLLKSPTIVAVKDDAIAVYDSGNKVIKFYDNNFNHRRTMATGNFRKEPAVAMRYNRFTNELYVITEATDGSLKLYRVQEDFTFSNPVELEESLDDGENVKEISFSENNSNFWYLVTTSYIYKKLINKPKYTVGAYDGGKIFVFYTYKWNYATFTYNGADLVWNASSNRTSSYDNFIGITCAPSTQNYDRVFMFKYGRFYEFEEPNDYLNLLNFTNTANYSLDSITISNKEFVQPAVYNKEIYKLVSNLLTLKNNIKGRYYGSYDLNGIYRLTGYDYLIDLDKFVISNIKNFIVHQNEGVTRYAINRTLANLYRLQKTLLDAVSIEIEGLVPYPLTSNTLVVD